MRVHLCAFTILSTFAGVVACSNVTPDTSDVDVDVDVDGLEQSTAITDNGWTMTSLTPTANVVGSGASTIYGGVTFARTSGPTTRKAGVCLLSVYLTQSTGMKQVCNTVADCGSYPTTLPAGGFRYCAAYDAGGTKFCMYRPGSPANFCTGTPANGGLDIAPGTYSTPTKLVSSGWEVQLNAPAPSNMRLSIWESYGCFAGCTTTDPATVYPRVVQQYY
jgi:hypothetical protein